ncbi:MAG: hypothetical protein ACREOE_18710, partial [Gemmatimonadales bacterium]
WPDGDWPDGDWPDGDWPDGDWQDGDWQDGDWCDVAFRCGRCLAEVGVVLAVMIPGSPERAWEGNAELRGVDNPREVHRDGKRRLKAADVAGMLPGRSGMS